MLNLTNKQAIIFLTSLAITVAFRLLQYLSEADPFLPFRQKTILGLLKLLLVQCQVISTSQEHAYSTILGICIAVLWWRYIVPGFIFLVGIVFDGTNAIKTMVATKIVEAQ